MANANTLTVLNNEASTLADALRTIDRDHSEQIAKMNADHKAKRSELVQELAALNRALKALRAPIVTPTGSAPTTGKELSDEHREKIRAALAKRSAARKAEQSESGTATSPVTLTPEQPAAGAESVSEEQSATPAKKAAAKKAVK